jgi:glucose-6-phosphate 1-epimerase
MWDKEFKATYTVKVTDGSLDTVFNVKNEGSEDFVHQAALHSYFDISSIKNLSIEGSFKGKEYLDKMKGETKTEDRDAITISEETDSVYMGVNDPSVVDSGKGKKISVVDAKGWTDCVIWNPFGNEGMGYDTFVCAESVAFNPVTVPAGGEWEGSMSLKAENI